MQIFEKIKRYRVSRGYSVHSPFAFYFITRVLRETLPFYCFKTEVTAKADRTLFRVVNYLQPATVRIVGTGTRASRAAQVIALACPRAAVTADSEADFTFVAAPAEQPGQGRVIYAETADTTPPADAMTFTNGRTLIAVRRHGLPAQNFRLNF